ncbi:MAG: DnaD domain protein [Bacilli bacterium]
MAKNFLYSAVSFRYALLDCYKKLNISEEELVILLMIDHLLEQGNTLVTADLLSMKMNYAPSDIDRIMVGLVNRGLLSYDTSEKNMRTSLDELKNQVYVLFQKSVEREQINLMSKEKAGRLSSLISFYEAKLCRSLSPLETQTMGDWLEAGYKDEEIQDALLDALKERKKTIRAVDKILRAKRRDDDIRKEGASAVNDNWNKDIEKTMEIAKAMWGGDDSKK